MVSKCVRTFRGTDWVELNRLFNVTINDISVMTANRCAVGLKKKLGLRSGSQRHRHFVGFFNVPVQATTRGQQLVAFDDTQGIRRTHSRLNPPGPHGDRWNIIICKSWTSQYEFGQLCPFKTTSYLLIFSVQSLKKIVAAFRGMHVSPAKHSFGKCDRQTDRQTDGRTTDKVIPMCRYASHATQKVLPGFSKT